MKDKTKLRELVRNHIEKRYQERMLNAIQPSIRLKTFRQKEVPIGDSKFGGIPHLPKSITWPHNEENRPYSFIAQISLEDISQYELDTPLPTKGMLYFFLDMDSWDDGVVLYFPQTESLYSPKIPKELEKEKKYFFQKLFRLKGKK